VPNLCQILFRFCSSKSRLSLGQVVSAGDNGAAESDHVGGPVILWVIRSGLRINSQRQKGQTTSGAGNNEGQAKRVSFAD
jgi:hypothetical protein